MSDDQFRQLCNTFGFAPSRALREMIDCVRAQEIEACAKVCGSLDETDTISRYDYRRGVLDCADVIRERKENT